MLEAPEYLKLDIGSGNRPLLGQGFTQVDMDANAGHLDVHSDGAKLPFPDEAAVEIYTSHFVEHLYPADVVPFLAECARVLRHDCWLRIHVPSLTNIAQAMEEIPLHDWARLNESIFGVDEFGLHHCMFNTRILMKMLQQQGFTEIRDDTRSLRDAHDDGWAEVLGGRYMSLKVAAKKP